MSISRITKVYTRHYRDNGQRKAYVEWIDNRGREGRTEGSENSLHMQELIKRGKRENNISIVHEVW
jgi:hypothetical protein